MKGDLVRGRTVLLVVSAHDAFLLDMCVEHLFQTHNVALAAPIAENIVTIGTDGLAHTVGTALEDILADPSLAREIEIETEETKIEEEVIDEVKKEDEKGDGKLILAEEIQEGRVSWRSFMLFLNGLGGAAPFFFLTLYVGALTLGQVTYMVSVWFLGVWALSMNIPPHLKFAFSSKLYIYYYRVSC